MRTHQIIKNFCALISFLFIASCAPVGPAMVWYKSTGGPKEFEQDKYSCLQQSQQQFGAAQINAYGGGSVNRMITNDDLLGSCLRAKGWNWQRLDLTEAQDQQNRVRNQDTKQDFDEALNVVKADCLKPEFKEYYSKTACLVNDITFEQLADDSKITGQQKITLLKQREMVSKNRKITVDLQIKHFGDLGRRRNDLAKNYLEPKEETNNLDLYNGKITWGQYSKNRKEISTDFRKRVNEIK